MSDEQRRIRADVERVFRMGVQAGFDAAKSGNYGNECPPIAVEWTGNQPRFVLQRPSITLQGTGGLHLPNGFRRH